LLYNSSAYEAFSGFIYMHSFSNKIFQLKTAAAAASDTPE
jgi:hypothetical protein